MQRCKSVRPRRSPRADGRHGHLTAESSHLRTCVGFAHQCARFRQHVGKSALPLCTIVSPSVQVVSLRWSDCLSSASDQRDTGASHLAGQANRLSTESSQLGIVPDQVAHIVGFGERRV